MAVALGKLDRGNELEKATAAPALWYPAELPEHPGLDQLGLGLTIKRASSLRSSGGMRERRRLLPLLLFGGARLRPDCSGRYLRARLSADRRGTALWCASVTEEDFVAPPRLSADGKFISRPATGCYQEAGLFDPSVCYTSVIRLVFRPEEL